MRGQAPISSIYRMGEQTGMVDPDRVFAKNFAVMRELWLQRGVVALYPSDLPNDLQPAIEQWASDTYGERKR